VPDPAARRAVRAELGIPETTWVAGTIGRLAPEKDQAALLRVMLPLLDENRQLVIVGDGPEKKSLHALVNQSESGRWVHMTGARSDPARLIAAFDAFVLSSRTEGLPIVLLEAMAAGLPVVSTDVGGIGDVVEHGRTGLLVRRDELAHLGAELIRLSEDQLLSRRLGKNAQELVRRRYSLARMADAYASLYEHARGVGLGAPDPVFARGA
jgi:glycosyltransferase involved in cell wall biosynthesis